MKKHSLVMLIVTLVGLSVYVGCSSDFTTPPDGSTISCRGGETATGGTGSLIGVTATVKNQQGNLASNVAVTVLKKGAINSFTLRDNITQATLPNQFVTQSDGRGLVTVDIVNCTSSASGSSACTVEFNLGAVNCSTTLTVSQ